MSESPHDPARLLTGLDPAGEVDESTQQAEVARLWDEHAPGMLRYGLVTTGSREVTEESVQEAFIALLGQLRRGELVVDAREFLYSAMHEGIQLRRAEPGPPPANPEAPSSVTPDFDAPLRAAEVRRRLNRIASPRELEMLNLRAAGFSYEEIARVLMITPGTVASTLARAFRKVRAAFPGVIGR
jgi:RNA polymerase sigma factor (sigma-70 family)